MPFGNEGDFPLPLEYVFTFRLTNTNPYLNAFIFQKYPQVVLQKLLFQIPKLLLGNAIHS